MRKLLLLNLAALSPREVTGNTPNLAALATSGTMSPLVAPFPSLTCTSHATMVTGTSPAHHGIVGNGWYDREHARVFMWNRSAHHVRGETLWDAARQRASGFKVANLFWRFVADSSCDLQVTERPVYWVSGRKTFDFFTAPSELHTRLVRALGKFPFMQFWGPFADLASSAWILRAAADVMEHDDPDLLLAYAPYLDYEAQRHGPDSAAARTALGRMDSELATLLAKSRALGRDVAIVSDYGFVSVTRPVFVNRVLREAGLLSIEAAANGDQIAPGASRAMAVCDNQVAHIYVATPADIPVVRTMLEATPGIARVLDAPQHRELEIDHPRSGELIAVAEADSWFAYPYWLRDERAPDFADCIAIFDKASFDPCELFARPGLLGKPHIALRVAQKMARLAVPFDVIDPDPTRPRGARNVANDADRGATLVTSWSRDAASVRMTELKALLLDRMFDAP